MEFLPDEERAGKQQELMLSRNDNAILITYKELWDKALPCRY